MHEIFTTGSKSSNNLSTNPSFFQKQISLFIHVIVLSFLEVIGSTGEQTDDVYGREKKRTEHILITAYKHKKGVVFMQKG